MKRSAQILEWAVEAEITAKALRESGEIALAARFDADAVFFLKDAAELEKKGE